eukprot:694409_1
MKTNYTLLSISFICAYASATSLDALYTTDTLLSITNSPYQVVSDVVISAGATLAIPNACGHSGQSEDVKDATVIWNTAIHEDHIKYNPYVITSLCDCLARYGKLQHAKQLIKEYEEHHSHQRKCIHYPMYMALFSGYCKKGDERMAQQVHKEMQSKFTDYQMKAPSVMLSNMHYQITNDTNFTNL